MTAFVPPLAIDRIVAQWHFDGGGFVALVSGGRQRPTAELLDAIQQLIDLKRHELSLLAHHTGEHIAEAPHTPEAAASKNESQESREVQGEPQIAERADG